MMNGIVTQMTSSFVLPWMCAPSPLSPGLGAEGDHAVDRDRHHEHEDRDRHDHQDVVERVDLLGLGRRPGSGTSRSARQIDDADDRGDRARGGASARADASGAPGAVPRACSRRAQLYLGGRPARPLMARRHPAAVSGARGSGAGRSLGRCRRVPLPVLCRRRAAEARRRARRGGGGTSSRTGPAGGSRRSGRPRGRGSRPRAAGARRGACGPSARYSRKLVSPTSAKTRWSWRREVAISRASGVEVEVGRVLALDDLHRLLEDGLRRCRVACLTVSSVRTSPPW